MRAKTYILLLILIIALILRAFGVNHGLPYNNRIFYETEESYTLQTAMAFGSGDLNPHTFNKPSLLYYMMFLVFGLYFVFGKITGLFSGPMDFAAYYFDHPEVFYLIARGVVVLFGVASVYLLYLIGKKLYGLKTGIVSALFLAVCGLHVSYSRQALSDIPQVFFILLSLYLSLKLSEGGKLSDYAACGFIAGMAASAKYYGGLVLIAPLSLHFLNKRPLDRRIIVLLALSLMGFVLFTPYAVLDYRVFFSHLKMTKFWAQDTALVNEALPVWALQYLKDLLAIDNLGAGLFLLSLGGIGYAAFKHTKIDIAFIIFISFIYGYFSLQKIAWSSVHYLLPAVPVMLLFASRFLVKISEKIPARQLFLALSVMALAVHPACYNFKQGRLLANKSTTNLAREWIEANIPAETGILMDRLYVPQLTLTEGALKRLKDFWLANANRTAENLRESLAVSSDKRSKLAELKDKSMTDKGIPYDVYLINYETFMDLEDYAKKYGVAYVILSEWVEDIYKSPFRSAQKKYAEYFYDSVRNEGDLIKEFVPNRINVPGSHLQIYKIKEHVYEK